MKLNNTNFLFLFLLSILILTAISSCEKSFDLPDNPVCEKCCDFEVKWRSQISEEQKQVIRNILQDMVLVEGDYFVMGATPEQAQWARPNEWPTQYVKLSDYFICKHEVTDDEFNKIMGTNISTSEKYASIVTLSQWKLFIELLNDFTSLHFNFPSEAQWEYAARGGKESQGFIYPGSNNWEDICSGSRTQGSSTPNELGIYNMGDLKGEWCLDYYSPYIPSKLLIDWVQTDGKDYVVRGGNYKCTVKSEDYHPLSGYMNYSYGYEEHYISQPNMDFRNCRITSRAYYYDHGKIGNNFIGLRLVIN